MQGLETPRECRGKDKASFLSFYTEASRSISINVFAT